MTIDTVISIAALVGIGLSILAAYRHNIRLRDKLVGVRPYTWGFFLGYVSIIPFALIALIAVISDQQLNEDVQKMLKLAVPFGILGVLVILRFRWAFVLHTLATMNPVLWIINTIYIKKRWKELSGNSKKVEME